MENKIYYLTTVVLVCVFFVQCTNPGYELTNELNAKNFSLRYPDKWELSPFIDSGNACNYRILSPDRVVVFTISFVEAPNSSLENETIDEQVSMAYFDNKLEKETLIINEKEFYKIQFQASKKTKKGFFTEYYIYKEPVLYIISFLTTNFSYKDNQQYNEMITNVVSSFTYKY